MILAVGKEVVKIPNLYKSDGKLWAAVEHSFDIPPNLKFKLIEYPVYKRLWNGKKYIDCNLRKVVST